MKAKRGDFGYINNRKKRTLTIAIIYSAISIGIDVLGLVLNHICLLYTSDAADE